MIRSFLRRGASGIRRTRGRRFALFGPDALEARPQHASASVRTAAPESEAGRETATGKEGSLQTKGRDLENVRGLSGERRRSTPRQGSAMTASRGGEREREDLPGRPR